MENYINIRSQKGLKDSVQILEANLKGVKLNESNW